jgi:AraC-like DNA-binding protein
MPSQFWERAKAPDLAVKRFDRDGSIRIHHHMLAALYQTGAADMDYSTFLRVTRRVTNDEREVWHAFRRAVAEHPLLRGLLATDAGYFPHVQGHRVERPLGAATHLMIACTHGHGWVRLNGRRQPIEPGDVVWLSADVAHAYGAAEQDPWTIIWVHFRGAEVPAWQQQLGWAARQPVGMTHFAPEQIAELRLDQIYPWLESGYAIPQLVGASAAEVGFEDPLYFSRCFRRIMGRSPRSYRAAVKG